MSVDLGRSSLETPPTPKASTDSPATPYRTTTEGLPVQDGEMRQRLDKVLLSDIGIHTLLTRLKQSIGSAREFSGFLKERSSLEEKHAAGIQRLTRSTHDLVGRPEHRQGSFATNYRELGVIHDRMAKNSENFAHNLMAMSDELQDVSAHCERGRKQWKHTGLEAEQRSQDADSAMEKAKQKYYSLAEQYDRVRTGERQGGKFGLKGPKSAAQQEESLLSKAEYADQEYRSRVEAAESQRQELFNTSRPQAVRELQNLIRECDAALSMQMQKFAVMNEKLLLGNGLCISPLKEHDNENTSGARSLREVAQAINNQRDFEEFVLSHSGKMGPALAELRYEKHPALTPTSQQQPPRQSNTFNDTPPRTDTGFNAPPQRTNTGFNSVSGQYNQGGQASGVVPHHTPPQQVSYSGPQSATTSTAPQLPQIGALSMGGRNSLEGGRSGPTNGRPDAEYRTFTGPNHTSTGPPQSFSGPNQTFTGPTQSFSGQNQTLSGPNQQRPNQPSYSGPPGYVPGTSTSPQANKDYNTTGPGYGPVPNATSGLGRDQPLSSSELAQGGLPRQNQYPHENRGPSLGQSTDPRSDGRGQQQGPAFRQHQPDSRGQPNQSSNYSPPSHTRPSTNISPVGPSMGAGRGPSGRPSLPPLRPVFGVPLDELFRRDGAAVPAIVYQCIQAVDLFGLNTEGIYRVPGSAQHVMELQALFDHDSAQVDFRTPTAFYNDIASVTTLLKQFLRDLPDPLLTSAQYNSFIQAAKIEEDIVRRDSLHAIINSLPDPNYATLRTLILHLYRVQTNSPRNRMTSSNIAIVFGPTLMGGHGGGPSGEIQDAGWQARVIETILSNTLQIFDDDDD